MITGVERITWRSVDVHKANHNIYILLVVDGRINLLSHIMRFMGYCGLVVVVGRSQGLYSFLKIRPPLIRCPRGHIAIRAEAMWMQCDGGGVVS